MGTKRLVKVLSGTASITLGDAFEDFILDKETQGLAEKTIQNYRQSYSYFLELEFDEDDTFEINEINKVYIQQWIDSMKKQKKKTTTINHYLRDVRTFLYWCMDEERMYIENRFKIELVKGQEPLQKVFTEDEVQVLLQRPTKVNDFYEWRGWAIVNWVLATGARASTICEVMLEDIDFTNKEIALRHTKNKKAQIIPMSSELEGVLKLYIRKCRSQEDSRDEGYLFCNQSLKKMTYGALALSFKRYCERRGVDRTNIHGLRHFFATYWARNGGSGDKLKKMLGHSTYTMTQRYISLADADLKDDYDKNSPLDNIKRKNTRRKNISMK